MGESGTVEFIGEENFQRVCRQFALVPEETEAVRKIFEQWDGAMSISDVLQRLVKKADIVFPIIAGSLPERRSKIILAITEIRLLFLNLRSSRQ